MASPAVPVVSCAAVGPVVEMYSTAVVSSIDSLIWLELLLLLPPCCCGGHFSYWCFQRSKRPSCCGVPAIVGVPDVVWSLLCCLPPVAVGRAVD